jgi:L-threonylcarbamoyladenylate synthase
MQTERLSADEAGIGRAAALLRAGRLVAFPTETVYGLGALALDGLAVRGIYAAKGRPATNPLIVHVASAAEARALVERWPPEAERLAGLYWPGPLTLVLPRAARVPDEVTAGGATVAVRAPAHPVAEALLRAVGAPLAAPSANRSEHVSPTSAEHVLRDLDGRVDAVLDGGACPVGIESTIVDATRGHPVLMRPGHITPAQLEAVCGQPVRARDAQAPRASGTLESHYAPTARVLLMDAPTLQAAIDQWPQAVPGPAGPARVAVYARSLVRALGEMLLRQMPNDAAQAAQALFATLRELDSLGVQQIWVETPPPGAEWDGVRDRLQRAAA